MAYLSSPGHVRDMNHSINTTFQLHKRAISGEVTDRAFDSRALRITGLGCVPRILLRLTDSQSDLLLFCIDTQHHHIDLIADRQDL